MNFSLLISETTVGLSLYFLGVSILRLWNERHTFFAGNAHFKNLNRFRDELHAVRDLLRAGRFPGLDWFQFGADRAPAQFRLSMEVLLELRSHGAPILPALERLSQAVNFQLETIQRIRVKAAPAKAQAFVIIGMIPTFSATLVILFPKIQDEYSIWAAVTAVALVLGMFGSFWIWLIIQKALRGGMTYRRFTQIEAFSTWLSALESEILRGVSPDLAWNCAYSRVFNSQSILGFGSQVWSESLPEDDLIRPAVVTIQKSIQLSLMEGRPSLERMSGAMSDYRERFRSTIFRELEILPTRILLPLFATLAPAILLLLGAALFLMMEDETWNLFVS